MSKINIITLDLNFLGISEAIASYLIPHASGAILVECGPGSTIVNLQTELASYGYSIADISDVLLTHIHLDHAGAAGWLSRQGARIHVHPVGAPHMLEPEKLLVSARRIYGDQMERLWGEFLPVLPGQLSVPEDEQEIEIHGLRFTPLDTPGHANHHYVYLFEGVCFSGDVGGVRIPGTPHLRLPMPPPEFHLEKWRSSLRRLQSADIYKIAPTHFGIFEDVTWHLSAIEKALDEIEAWMEDTMPQGLPIEELNRNFLNWTHQRSLNAGLLEEEITPYESANPSWMSTYGIERYWRKYRTESSKNSG
jgi:glyoxylase-like metal-dependent hydrolase (beta-lactamase superfamily II)